MLYFKRILRKTYLFVQLLKARLERLRLADPTAVCHLEASNELVFLVVDPAWVQGWVVFTLRPWMGCWGCEASLLAPKERLGYRETCPVASAVAWGLRRALAARLGCSIGFSCCVCQGKSLSATHLCSPLCLCRSGPSPSQVSVAWPSWECAARKFLPIACSLWSEKQMHFLFWSLIHSNS